MESKIYVIIQVILLILIVVFGQLPPYDWVFYLVGMGGFFMILWSAIAKKISVSIFPEPTKNMPLITSGPYQFVRHPMYFGVLLTALSLFPFGDGMYPFLLIWVSLLILFLFKINYEEKAMARKFSEYKKYAGKTKKLIPFLY